MVNLCSAPLWSAFSVKSLGFDPATVRRIPNFSFLLWCISANGVFPPWRAQAPCFEILNSGSTLKQGFFANTANAIADWQLCLSCTYGKWKFFVKRYKVLLEAEL